jgi:hypothetical protein
MVQDIADDDWRAQLAPAFDAMIARQFRLLANSEGDDQRVR